MNENDLAKRLVAHLDRSLAGLPAQTAQKLQSARLAAMSRHRPAEALGVAGLAGTLQSWTFDRSLTTRLALPAAIVIATVVGLLYWQMSAQHEDELDASLLAGELPIHAYIDPGFDAWLKHTSHTPQQ